MIAADSGEVHAIARRALYAAPERRAQTAAEPLSPHAATKAHYYLVILNNGSVYRDAEELPAVHGAPYPALRAVIYERAPFNAGAHTLQVKPYCISVVRCEFVPPRGAGIPERFVLRLADDSAARLSVRDDSVVITATQLEFPNKTTLRLMFEPAGLSPAVRLIVYSQPDDTG